MNAVDLGSLTLLGLLTLYLFLMGPGFRLAEGYWIWQGGPALSQEELDEMNKEWEKQK